MIMRDILSEKIKQLEQSKDFECWYLVKQSVDFTSLCYKVYFLDSYKKTDKSKNIESYINDSIDSLNKSNPSLNIEKNYRQLRIAAFFGLIEMKSSKYEEASITDVFYEIQELCNGKFENINLYQHIIDRQIEKLYVSSIIDEGKQDVRKDFSIYPVIFLYKLLLEIGYSTGKYLITFDEYRYIVTTTKKYEDFAETLILIKLLRDNPEYNSKLIKFRMKFDNRINQALGLLSTLKINQDRSIELNIEKLQDIKQKVLNFDLHKDEIEKENYIQFLCSKNGFLVYKHTNNFQYLSSEWFKSKEPLYTSFDKDAETYSILFNEKYGPETLKHIKKEDLPAHLFLGKQEDNLCHELEYNKTSIRLFTGIGGGSTYVYPCFFRSNTQTWVTGSSRKNRNITNEEAIEIASETLDKLLLGYNLIQSYRDKLTDQEAYSKLSIEMVEKLGNLADKSWVLKYFTILFYDLFSPFYSDEWQKKALNAIGCEEDDNKYVQNGSITLVAKESNISTIVLSRIIYDILGGKFDSEKNIANNNSSSTFNINDNERIKNGENVIIYGVPGAGKSHLVQEEYLKGAKEDEIYERLVFHPDYTYSDFVGQIMPIVNTDKSVSYEFTAGPFSRILKKAFWNPQSMYFLVIEEVNRGNAAAIFGDVFQLLDRDADGNSRYKITNKDIAKIVYGDEFENEKVFIPSNLTILCTMNTSDQNVFTLDTAFQRRWKMRLVPNTFKDDTSGIGDVKILDTDLTWKKFCEQINRLILEKSETLSSSEDKRLGTHFVEKTDLYFDKDWQSSNAEKRQKALKQNHLFAEKVIKYLWDDVFKYDRSSLFESKYKSLEDVINDFVLKTNQERFNIFKEDIQRDLQKVIDESKNKPGIDNVSSD